MCAWKGSARQLSRLVMEHDAYRWISGGVHVNHHLPSDFRVRHGAALDELLSATAIATLPDGVARELDSQWFTEGEAIRVADAFVFDLRFAARGESLDTLAAHVVTIDLDVVPLRTLDLEGLLKTIRSLRDKDRADRVVLERAIEALRRDKAADDRWDGARRCAACCSQRHRGP